MNFGTWLSERLAERRLQQSQLATYVGVSQSAVSAWVRGRSLPKPQQCAGIARVLQVPLADVLAAAGHPVPGDTTVPTNGVADRLKPLIPLLAQLDDYEIQVVEATARGLLRLREERAATGGPPPVVPDSGRARDRGPKETGLR